MGNTNAAVLPVPVCAQAIKSLSAKIRGIVWVCMGVGLVKPIESRPSKSL